MSYKVTKIKKSAFADERRWIERSALDGTSLGAAAIAMEKIATMTPMGGCGCELKRQNATKFTFAAASIISIPIKMKMAWRRLSAASSPMENKAVETTRKS